MGTSGNLTKQIVAKLSKSIKQFDCKIITDLGSKQSANNIFNSTLYFGNKISNDATLSNADIVILKENKVLLIVEVEESNKTRPKTIIGDIYSILLSDRIKINDKSYRLNGTEIIAALVTDTKGKRHGKYIRLERRIQKHLVALKASGLCRGINKIRIIPSEVNDIVRRIERLIRLEIGKDQR